jgi:hypothetical protein
MLACGHDREPFGVPVCAHLRADREPYVDYLRWYTGAGMDTHLLCRPSAEERENGRPVQTEVICRECFEYATTKVGELRGVRGRPEIVMRAEPFNARLLTTTLPNELGVVTRLCRTRR